jgi:heme exporter protein A
VLEAAAVGCERGGRTLFRELSFALARGEALRIAGPNGAGKTSLLRILCGLAAPAAGEVRWKGEAIGSLREDYSAQLVYLGHSPGLKDELTAAENLSIACRLAGNARKDEDILRALRHLGVPEAVLLRRLSQGQRRRAALARLLLSAAAPLWLLDEPFAALDARAIGLVEELVTLHLTRGGIAVFTTHQDSRLAARVIELDA